MGITKVHLKNHAYLITRVNFNSSPRYNDNLQFIPQKYENFNLTPKFVQKIMENGAHCDFFF